MSRIINWLVPLDDKWHKIGKGPVALVAEPYKDPDYMSLEGPFAKVWTIEPDGDDDGPTRAERIMAEQGVKPKIKVAKVVGTNHIYPDQCEHLGSYKSGKWVWHVIAVMVDEERFNASNT